MRLACRREGKEGCGPNIINNGGRQFPLVFITNVRPDKPSVFSGHVLRLTGGQPPPRIVLVKCLPQIKSSMEPASLPRRRRCSLLVAASILSVASSSLCAFIAASRASLSAHFSL